MIRISEPCNTCHDCGGRLESDEETQRDGLQFCAWCGVFRCYGSHVLALVCPDYWRDVYAYADPSPCNRRWRARALTVIQLAGELAGEP
jgi:hypothetical protein